MLSLNDPCSHVSRMDIIKAKLNRDSDDGQALFDIIQHMLDCPERRDIQHKIKRIAQGNE